jgi:hypothetical protein
MWSGHPYASIYTADGKVFIRYTGNPLTDPIDFAEMWSRRSSALLYDSVASLYGAYLIEREPWYEKKSFIGFAWFEEPPGGTWIHFPLWAPLAAIGLLGTCFALNWKPRFSLRALLLATALVAAFITCVRMRAG